MIGSIFTIIPWLLQLQRHKYINKLFIPVWRIKKREPKYLIALIEGGQLISIHLIRGSNHQIWKITLKNMIINSNLFLICTGKRISHFWNQLTHRRTLVSNYNIIHQRIVRLFSKEVRASNSRDRCLLIIILDSINSRKC